MAERIIDWFEAIQVNEQYGKPERLPCGAFNGDSHAISKECTVGKSGEGIVVREIQDALFRRLALGNIARKDNEMRVEPGIDGLRETESSNHSLPCGSSSSNCLPDDSPFS